MLEEIRLQTRRLADHPQLGRPSPDEYSRELVVARTPYIVVYEIHGDAVQILALYHHAQKRP